MFLGADGFPVVQEYTTNHNGGTRHCSETLSEDATCVNACFFGELWSVTGYPAYTGPPPAGKIVTILDSALSQPVNFSTIP